ncbi:glycosyltransferase family protein [Solidesulfovibrio magneticus]|nr:glycosyltransferase [Solidesulfovibrio magneticus]
MAHMDRPNRAVVIDETGARRTLAAGEAAFEALAAGGRPLFLGLGPDPGVAVALAGGQPADWLECPAFEAAMGPDWLARLPAGWKRLTPGDLTPGRVRAARVIFYRQNSRLFPSFWGPVLARLQLALLPGPDRAARSPGVILPRPAKGLLEPEIARALTVLGRPALDIAPEACPAALAALLSRQTPSALLSINGAGLDDEGISAALLAEAGVPLAIWFVDNPFHVLGRFRGGFWKRALLAVTDDSFIEPLRRLGAARTLHLPLGASAHFFAAAPTPELADGAVFVGRSAFAGRDAFFAGCRLPDGLTDTARAMVAAGGRPDYFWWAEKLGLGALWPGKAGRAAGLGAETASLALRAGALAAVAEAMPLVVYGDEGWRELLPEGVSLFPPVDYYGTLPGLYAGGGVTLNATSLLLPRGLTQRHFDVWAAGGCLVTDATPGLDLFPAALTAPVSYAAPGQAGKLAANLLAQPQRRADLAASWREAIAAGHRYEHRLAALFARLSDDF